MRETSFEMKTDLFIALDYIDLRGNAQSVTIEAKDETDAVDSVRTAWNANLLWHFHLHLKQAKPLSKTRSIPWTEIFLRRALALPRLLALIESAEVHLNFCEQDLIKECMHTEKPDHHKISALGTANSLVQALRAAYEKHAVELEKSGISIPVLAAKSRLQALECAAKAARNLDRLKSGTKTSESGWSGPRYITRIKSSKFLESLPRIDGIFTSTDNEGLLRAIDSE